MQIPPAANLLHALSDLGQGIGSRPIEAASQTQSAAKPTATPQTQNAVSALAGDDAADGSFRQPEPGQPIRRGMLVDMYV
ncbi:MAG: hypothetical protein H6842_11050 [Rhodospirillaceae bacterium]|nr:hypothetical protein [Rhodospirillaceae bacterium]